MWKKAWLETRTRFLAGALLLSALSLFFMIGNPLILNQWKLDSIVHPEWIDPDWMPRANNDYSFFIWHFLYNYLLQMLWVLFTVCLALGGIQGEHERGALGFTLSLPLTRKKLFFSRVLTGYMQSVLLALIPVIVLPFSSLVINKEYTVVNAFSHSIFFIIGGMVFYSIAVFLNTILRNEFASYLISISFIIVFYYFFQPYAEGLPKPLLLKLIDVPAIMAAESEVSVFKDFSLKPFAACVAVSTIFISISYKLIRQRDF